MKRLICACVAALLIFSAAHAEGIYDCVRLQVVAEDDSASAQYLKLKLRDVCVRCAEVCAGDAADADAAYMRIRRHREAFADVCKACAAENGYGGKIRVETGVFHFPTRVYGKIRLPAGEYRALRVTVGTGEGHNWWCVLYPSLCLLNEYDYTADAPCYSAVLRWLKSRIGGAA